MDATRTRKVKTDRRDARALRDACLLGAYRPAHRLSDPQRHVRGRLTVRDAVVRTRTRYIVLNGVALAAWLIPTVTGTAATDRRLTEALTAVERVVETARDGGGRVPERLDHLLSGLPPDVARMVLDGDITYRPSPDRSRYDLVPALRTSPPGR